MKRSDFVLELAAELSAGFNVEYSLRADNLLSFFERKELVASDAFDVEAVPVHVGLLVYGTYCKIEAMWVQDGEWRAVDSDGDVYYQNDDFNGLVATTNSVAPNVVHPWPELPETRGHSSTATPEEIFAIDNDGDSG